MHITKHDDGTIKVDHFDGYLEIDEEFLKMHDGVTRTGDYVKVVVDNGIADYRVLGKLPDKDAWRCQLIKGVLKTVRR
jgi:hypothetical protein